LNLRSGSFGQLTVAPAHQRDVCVTRWPHRRCVSFGAETTRDVTPFTLQTNLRWSNPQDVVEKEQTVYSQRECLMLRSKYTILIVTDTRIYAASAAARNWPCGQPPRPPPPERGGFPEALMSILIVLLILILVLGGLPQWGYHPYGYYPSGLGTILVIVLVVLLLTGRL
jgi:hypothetical protein